jgi:sulfatase modifying factor 1
MSRFAGLFFCALWIIQITVRLEAQNGDRYFTEPITGMIFRRIDPGEFQMGSPEAEPGRESQETLHTVQISHAFYMGIWEVTQQQWKTIMGEHSSSFQNCGPDCPVENVTWNDVAKFIEKLNARSSSHFRLPTEAEWEYACRAGTTTPFSTGVNLTTDQANYDGNHPYSHFPKGVFRKNPTAAGTFMPNNWQLFDMHGNVWEWTADAYCPYAKGRITDPQPQCADERKVIRGGSWYFGADSARCALRYTHRPQDKGFSIGFRLALNIQ